jgi:hypothetical protein
MLFITQFTRIPSTYELMVKVKAQDTFNRVGVRTLNTAHATRTNIILLLDSNNPDSHGIYM